MHSGLGVGEFETQQRKKKKKTTRNENKNGGTIRLSNLKFNPQTEIRWKFVF